MTSSNREAMRDPDIDAPASTHLPRAGGDLLERYRSMTGLVAALADLRPLLAAIRRPVVITPPGAGIAPGADRLQVILSAMFAAVGLAPPVVRAADDDELSLSECVINERLREALDGIPQGGFDGLREVDDVARLPAYVRQYLDEVYHDGVVIDALDSLDGAPLTTYRSVGKQHSVVLALPCGAPFQMARAWVAFLRRSYNVVTWETRSVAHRGGAGADDWRAYLDAQSDDLQAVVQRYCPEPPHVMGICGGAVVALNAARRKGLRLAGMSLWYGDYNFNDSSLQTDYQRNLQWMMETAGGGRESAQIVHDLFNDKAMLKSLNKRHAAAILCPYADVDSLWRYALLNGAIMAADVAAIAAELAMFISVISSENDRTAHPGGSRRLAELLVNSRLYMEQDGDHLSFFEAGPHTRAIALECIHGSFPARDAARTEVDEYAV
jgi:pimeloyl-ACP methyl ester carboxylesterase